MATTQDQEHGRCALEDQGERAPGEAAADGDDRARLAAPASVLRILRYGFTDYVWLLIGTDSMVEFEIGYVKSASS